MAGIVYCTFVETVCGCSVCKQDHNKVLLISVACLKEREKKKKNHLGIQSKNMGLLLSGGESFVKRLDFSFQCQSYNEHSDP